MQQKVEKSETKKGRLQTPSPSLAGLCYMIISKDSSEKLLLLLQSDTVIVKCANLLPEQRQEQRSRVQEPIICFYVLVKPSAQNIKQSASHIVRYLSRQPPMKIYLFDCYVVVVLLQTYSTYYIVTYLACKYVHSILIAYLCI